MSTNGKATSGAVGAAGELVAQAALLAARLDRWQCQFRRQDERASRGSRSDEGQHECPHRRQDQRAERLDAMELQTRTDHAVQGRDAA